MVTKIINGSALADHLRKELKIKVGKLRVKPGLAVILVGDDPASKIYVDFKKKASAEVGLYLETYDFPEDIDPKIILELLEKLNVQENIHGILVQLPLPEQFNETEIIKAITPEKDVDGFHPENIGWLSIGTPHLVSATAKAVEKILESTHQDLAGKHAVIIGASNIVGKPVSQLLLNKNMTVTVCHEQTKDLTLHTQTADVIITAVGKPGLLTAEMVKTGAIIIDVGITRLPDGRVVGDVDFENVKNKASFITPVPGGVGPLTVAMLLENTYLAAQFKR